MSPRRSNGEGTAPRKRSDGRWQINARTTNTTTGDPTRRTFYGHTRAEVVAKARAWRQAQDNGGLEDPHRTTLAQWVEHWLSQIAKPKLGARTWLSYAGYLRKWVTPAPLGDKQLGRVTGEDIDRLHTRMRAARKSETTINLVHRILSKCLNDAVKRGRLGTNPARKVTAPRPAEFEPVTLTTVQARRLLAAAEDEPVWGPGFIVNLALGLRQGERLGLCWEDVDFARGVLSVRREIGPLPWQHGCTPEGSCGARPAGCPERHSGGLVMFSTKSAAGRRDIALPGPVLEALQAQRDLVDSWQTMAGESWEGFTDSTGVSWDLVFCQPNGRPIGNKEDRAAWRRFTEGQGIVGMRVHDARHTAATVLLTLGVAPRVVMGMMGWSQQAMLGRYQHVLDEMKAEAATRVEGLLWGPETTADPGPGVAGAAHERGEGAVVDFQAFRARRGA